MHNKTMGKLIPVSAGTGTGTEARVRNTDRVQVTYYESGGVGSGSQNCRTRIALVSLQIRG